MRRRDFLYSCGLSLFRIAGLFFPRLALANWPAERFSQTEFGLQFERVYAGLRVVDSELVEIELPETAEDGAVVPLTLSSAQSSIRRFDIWVEKNPTPLAMQLELSPGVAPYMTARIKMAESCHVVVMADFEGRWLRRRRWVNVMHGGCGTG